MEIKGEILRMLGQAKRAPAQAGEQSNLYLDLGLDSISFISLLLDIEQAYSIAFDLSEMECCLKAGSLIELVEKKVAENERS